MENKPIILRFTTPHYQFDMSVTENRTSHRMIHFITGNESTPCLEGIITLENLTGNERYDFNVNTAKLIKIDALRECSLHDITNEYMDQYSFGKEMLDAIIFFIHYQFEMIQTISLDDKSYIPCIRGPNSDHTLDLLTYSIALHKKTWYEDNINAYIKPKHKYDQYRTQVEQYGSKKTKEMIKWEDMYEIMIRGSKYTKKMIEDHVLGQYEAPRD